MQQDYGYRNVPFLKTSMQDETVPAIEMVNLKTGESSTLYWFWQLAEIESNFQLISKDENKFIV